MKQIFTHSSDKSAAKVACILSVQSWKMLGTTQAQLSALYCFVVFAKSLLGIHISVTICHVKCKLQKQLQADICIDAEHFKCFLRLSLLRRLSLPDIKGSLCKLCQWIAK
jgi:hypothetical protein